MSKFGEIRKLIWDMLEEMGIDLEYDDNNENSEICDKYLEIIREKIKR